jgi:hypothetical protein
MLVMLLACTFFGGRWSREGEVLRMRKRFEESRIQAEEAQLRAEEARKAEMKAREEAEHARRAEYEALQARMRAKAMEGQVVP